MPATIIPGFRYVDAVGAIDFLCKAFGFERHAVYADDADPALIHHAQLTLGDGMVMLGSARSRRALRERPGRGRRNLSRAVRQRRLRRPGLRRARSRGLRLELRQL